MKEIFTHPSRETLGAIGHCREEFAQTRGVHRSAIDHLMIGTTKDTYPAFRTHFKDVCLTREADPDAYLNDLLAIKQSARGGSIDVVEAFLDKLGKANRTIEVCAAALADGKLDKQECLAIIPLLSKTRDAVEILLQSVLDRKAELDGCDVRQFAREKVNGRGK